MDFGLSWSVVMYHFVLGPDYRVRERCSVYQIKEYQYRRGALALSHIPPMRRDGNRRSSERVGGLSRRVCRGSPGWIVVMARQCLYCTACSPYWAQRDLWRPIFDSRERLETQSRLELGYCQYVFNEVGGVGLGRTYWMKGCHSGQHNTGMLLLSSAVDRNNLSGRTNACLIKL